MSRELLTHPIETLCSMADRERGPQITTVTLPWPPAVNNLYLNVGKRRIRTKRYDAWLSEALTAVREQRAKPIAGSFSVSIACRAPDRRIRDLDGLMKAPLDLLVKAGVIEDDSKARQLSIWWSPEPIAKPGSVIVNVWSA